MYNIDGIQIKFKNVVPTHCKFSILFPLVGIIKEL